MMDADEEYFKKHGEPLFSSHMVDLSEEPKEENIALTKKYVERAAPMKQWIEMVCSEFTACYLLLFTTYHRKSVSLAVRRMVLTILGSTMLLSTPNLRISTKFIKLSHLFLNISLLQPGLGMSTGYISQAMLSSILSCWRSIKPTPKRRLIARVLSPYSSCSMEVLVQQRRSLGLPLSQVL